MSTKRVVNKAKWDKMGVGNIDDKQGINLGPQSRKICRAVLELVMMISAFCMAVAVALTLPDILTVSEIEPKTEDTVGALGVWNLFWICIGAALVYFWGFLPTRKFLTDPELQGQRRVLFLTIARIGALWGLLLALLFITFTELLTLIDMLASASEAERSILNVLCMIIMFMVWRCIEFSMHAHFNKAFDISSARKAPWAWVHTLLITKHS